MTQPEKELMEEKFKGVYARLDANNELIHATLARIETQVLKTNGRVNCLEGWRWKVIGIVIGSVSILGFLMK